MLFHQAPLLKPPKLLSGGLRPVDTSGACLDFFPVFARCPAAVYYSYSITFTLGGQLAAKARVGVTNSKLLRLEVVMRLIYLASLRVAEWECGAASN
ncbi:MAG TPA: hypothetical protein VF598_06655 [Hymenobacter sp.]|jgi:hypothetical protein